MYNFIHVYGLSEIDIGIGRVRTVPYHTSISNLILKTYILYFFLERNGSFEQNMPYIKIRIIHGMNIVFGLCCDA